MKTRIDALLTKMNLTRSRSEAQDMINRGYVYVKSVQVKKASKEYEEPLNPEDVEIRAEQYVGRGAYKLEKAIQEFDIQAEGKIALDIGSSTGGFTEVLLKHGARKVYAVDVGKDQLAPSLRNDSRVVSLEETDIRTLRSLPEPVSLIVIDVSFISLSYIIPHLERFIGADADVGRPAGVKVIALIKPQFEVTKENLNKNGIVKDQELSEEIIGKISAIFKEHNFNFISVIESPIEGGSGNKEYLGCFEYVK